MEFERLFRKLSRKVRKKLASSPRCHDWEHTTRVIHNAELILEQENKADRKVVVLGALMHDIARADEIAIKGKCCHAVRGAEIADEILKKYDVSKNFRKRVVQCVKTHRYRSAHNPISIEEMIVYDADKLDSIGAVGIGRAFLFAGNTGAKLHNSKKVALSSSSYSENDTAYREYLVKLRHIPERMLTKTGKKIAQERVEFMKVFFDRLSKETNIN